jgi:hypothetical protein
VVGLGLVQDNRHAEASNCCGNAREFLWLERVQRSQDQGVKPTFKTRIRAKENAMFKTLLLAACTTALVLTPAYAGASKECTDQHMKQMDEMIGKMTDPAKQKEAKAALDKSKAGMKSGNDAECMKYMNEAHEAMGI